MLTAILELKGDKGAEVLAYYNMHSSDRHFNYIVLTFMYVAWLAIGFFVARSKITGTFFEAMCAMPLLLLSSSGQSA